MYTKSASNGLCSVVVGGDDVVNALVGVALGLLPVDEVKTLGLDLAVDEGTREAGEELLRLSVAGGLAVLGAVPLVSLGSLAKTQSASARSARSATVSLTS